MVRTNYLTKSLDLFATTLIPLDLPEGFKQIYYYLYSNSNIPRAERLGAEMIRILFCKIYDEIHNKNNKEFVIILHESDQETGNRVRKLFEKVKTIYPDVFDREEEKIYLDDKSLKYVIERLQNYALVETERDVISEAFQAFWGPGLRGEKGQFFTPRNVVRMCVDILNPAPGEKVIDPACGSGGFLVETLSQLKKNDEECFCSVYGIDKEIDLVKICKAYMAIVGDGHANIFYADSLHRESWSDAMKKRIEDGSFDVVLTNPPFGAKIFIEDKKILKNYKLGHEWIKEHSNNWKITNSVSKQVPQILFIERCLQLLKPDGRMAIVLPDGIFGNPSDRYVWHFISENAKISAIISLPPETFLPSTHTKTSVLFLEHTKNNGDEDYDIFMGIANKVGHDKNGKTMFKMDTKGNYILDNRGNKMIDDDLPLVVSKYREFVEKGYNRHPSHLGFTIKSSEIGDYIFVPSYYDPETMQKLKEMEKTGMYRLMTIRELVEQGAISVKRGHEVGSRYYGMGDVPFVRTSDIVNWEIKIDPVKSIPEEIYEKYRKKQDVKENDILLVTDGTFLIGRTAIVTSFDKKVGERLYEIVLPVPTDKNIISWIIKDISEIIKMKVEARRKMEELIRSGKDV